MTDQIQELSTNLLAKYKTLAGAKARQLDKDADKDFANDEQESGLQKIKKANKKFKGVVQATRKQFDNDIAKVRKEKLLSDGVLISKEDAIAILEAGSDKGPIARESDDVGRKKKQMGDTATDRATIAKLISKEGKI